MDHFWSLWYDLTWGWTSVSRTLGEHSTHKANEPVNFLLLQKIVILLKHVQMLFFFDIYLGFVFVLLSGNFNFLIVMLQKYA